MNWLRRKWKLRFGYPCSRCPVPSTRHPLGHQDGEWKVKQSSKPMWKNRAGKFEYVIERGDWYA